LQKIDPPFTLVSKRSYAKIGPDPSGRVFCIPGVTMAAGLIDDDVMLTQAEAAKAIGVSRQLVRDWCLRKKERITTDGHGRYRYGDLLKIESEARNCGRRGVYRRKPQLIAA
jgi:hypothetical protein